MIPFSLENPLWALINGYDLLSGSRRDGFRPDENRLYGQISYLELVQVGCNPRVSGHLVV